jgi:hypothetical protein
MQINVRFSLCVCGPANKWVVLQDATMLMFIEVVWRARLLFDLRVCCLRFNHGIGTHCFATPCPKLGPFFGLGIGPRNTLIFSTNRASDVGRVTWSPWYGCVWGTDLLGMERQRRAVLCFLCASSRDRSARVRSGPTCAVAVRSGLCRCAYRFQQGHCGQPSFCVLVVLLVNALYDNVDA